MLMSPARQLTRLTRHSPDTTGVVAAAQAARAAAAAATTATVVAAAAVAVVVAATAATVAAIATDHRQAGSMLSAKMRSCPLHGTCGTRWPWTSGWRWWRASWRARRQPSAAYWWPRPVERQPAGSRRWLRMAQPGWVCSPDQTPRCPHRQQIGSTGSLRSPLMPRAAGIICLA